MSYQQSIIDSLKIVNKQQSTTIVTTVMMQTRETFSFDFSLIKTFFESEKFYDFSTFIFECLLLLLNSFFVFMCFFIFHRCGFLKRKTWAALNFFLNNFDIAKLKQEGNDNACGNNYLRFVDHTHSTGTLYFCFYYKNLKRAPLNPRF
jgi:hypothetical protein